MSAGKMLIPTDFSDAAKNAAAYGMLLAAMKGMDVLFLHAGAQEDDEELKRLNEEVQRVSSAAAALPIHFKSVEKQFSSQLLAEVVEAEGISMVVMGTRGAEESLSKKLLGTNTRKIIETCLCPVLAIPTNCTFNGINEVAYATDLGDLENELKQVVDFTRSFNASIIVFHITPVFPDLANEEHIDVQVKVNGLMNKFNYPLISLFVQEMEEDNQVREGMEEFLKNHATDILMLFHNRNGLLEKYFSYDHVSEALASSKIPVMVFPKSSS
jgi:nucleotide-binding universal stress UspA family protein